MGVNIFRRTEGEHLPVEIQVNADATLAYLHKVVQSISPYLRIDDIHAAVNQIWNNLDDMPVCVHVYVMARIAKRLVYFRKAGLQVLAPFFRTDRQAVLHTEVISEIYSIPASFQFG